MRKIICIYALVNLVNGKMYVGSAMDLENRKRKHLHRLRMNKHHSPILQNAWNKYGESSFEFRILENIDRAETRKDLTDPEQKWIDKLNPYYNVCKVANSMIGFKHSEESRAKIRAARAKQFPHRKGAKLSEEQIEKMRRDNLGKRYSAETNKKKGLSGERNPYYGKKHSPEIRLKMRLAQKAYRDRQKQNLI